MIDKVLILGIRRAKELIPDFEIAQMIGRCGRSYTESGEATIIVPQNDESIAFEYISSRPKAVSSKLHVKDIAFHYIPSIESNSISSEEDFSSWYSRSLSFAQGKNVKWEDVCSFLIECECATAYKNKLVLSELGKVSSKYYIHPERVSIMKSRIEQIIISGDLDEISLSWILAYSEIHKDLSENMDFQQYLSETSGRGYFFDEDQIDAYAWFCAINHKKPKQLKNEIYQLRKDSERMLKAVEDIFSLLGSDVKERMNALSIRLNKGIPKELAGLAIEFPDAKRQILFEIDSLGIHNQRDIDDKLIQIESYGTNELKRFIEQLRSHKTEQIERDM